MLEKLKKMGKKTKEAISSAAVLVGDLNGDGKVDHEDAKIAAKWAKEKANMVGDEAVKLGKHTIESDMAKDAAAGAAVGAVVAVPVPVIGPPMGAAIGASIGVYKNLTNKHPPINRQKEQSKIPKDVYAELLKLDDLKQKGIVSEEEFEAQKKKLLKDV